MIKNIVITSLVIIGILFNGCDTDSDAQESLKSQQMFDEGDYEGVITSLESKPNRTSSENITLGTAYMAAVDLSLTDLTLMVSDIDSSSPSRTLSEYSNDSYAQFANKIQETSNKELRI